MKIEWNSAKMADVFDLQMGKTPDRSNAAFWNGSETWVAIGDMGESKYISSSKEMITSEAVSVSGIKRVPANTVIMSFKLSVGKVAIAKSDLYTNEAIMAFNVKPGYDILPEYVYYYLKGYKWQGSNRAVMGVTLNKASISQGNFKYSDSQEQSRIVAELDLLTGIIDKQNAQLKELDNLAQAIFYDMFGDPIENPKGWEVKKMGDVAQDIFAGGDKPEDCSDQLSDEYRYPVIANGVGDRGVLGYSKEYRVGVDAVTVGARGASIGNCRICKAFFTPVVRLITIIPGVNFDIVYLFYAVQLLNFNINGAGQAQLTVPNVKSQNVVVPPLALQQSFAEKIQSIEKQKETIRASIADTQKLLDYTMDKYFG
ncbi:restriction endonuclease subunit S [uncultured Fibrobacter sp.]|uniref:restriction endonuclease subunit S n=1 Tax=uncultured Fibrobacter sp. TaxID=261512 RepID=UPI0025E26EF5|nr:restriction endonuclease subunit S [uncultured Fibrobacter sp.]